MLKKILVSGYCALFTGTIFAITDPYAPVVPQVWSSIITVSGGPVWAKPGKDQFVYPLPPPFVANYYVAHTNWDLLGSGELFFGLQNFIGNTTIIWQGGLGVAAASDAYLSGTVNVNDVLDVYKYHYNVSHVRAEFKQKLIANGFQTVQPYLSGSFGVGFNHAHGFSLQTIDPILYPRYWFDSNSMVAFSYTLGAGVQKMLTQNWQVGVGYEFGDWGKNYLGDDDITTKQGPGMPHLYTNELLFSVSYLY